MAEASPPAGLQGRTTALAFFASVVLVGVANSMPILDWLTMRNQPRMDDVERRVHALLWLPLWALATAPVAFLLWLLFRELKWPRHEVAALAVGSAGIGSIMALAATALRVGAVWWAVWQPILFAALTFVFSIALRSPLRRLSDHSG